MNRRILPFSLVVCGAMLAYACSSSDGGSTPTPTPGIDGATPNDNDSSTGDPDASTNPDTSTNPIDSSVPPSGNPIEGIQAPVDVPNIGAIYTEGPLWHTDGLYFSAYGSTGAFVKIVPPATPNEVRKVVNAGDYPLGNAFDPKVGGFVSTEVKDGVPGGAIVRTPAAGGAGTAIALTFEAGKSFDSPNDLIVRNDGIIYVTDPGYQASLGPASSNHIWTISTTNLAKDKSVEGRPNGIALSVDQKTLYVSFTSPASPALPTINKYPLAADGTIGTEAKFADVGPADSVADGLAIDTAGNVYVAVKNGVDVFKADGSAKWGHITTTKLINGLSFGGSDKKTLFMTSDSGMLQVTVKIAGLE